MTMLEILHQIPSMPVSAPPLLFLHGAYAGAWCWESFLEGCAAHGYDAYALSFRGHGRSPQIAALDSYGIDDYVQDLESAIETLPQSPILIAHSMGGFVAQRYLSRGGKVAALALLASVPPYGLTGSALYMGMFYPRLLVGLNQFEFGPDANPDLNMVRELLFSADMTEQKLVEFAAAAQRESSRALMEMMLPQPWRLWAMPQVPALVLGAKNDRVIPESDVWATARALGVEPDFMPGQGHALMLDVRRDQVLMRLLAWLADCPWKG